MKEWVRSDLQACTFASKLTRKAEAITHRSSSQGELDLVSSTSSLTCDTSGLTAHFHEKLGEKHGTKMGYIRVKLFNLSTTNETSFS
jgi:hypothetical protein